jgi:hypothetical protein
MRRRGASVTQIAVVLVMLGVVGIFAGGVMRRLRRPVSPLQLLGLAPGMSLRALEKAVHRDTAGRLSCRWFAGRGEPYQYCVITLPGSHGDMFALVDPTKHVTAVQLFQLSGKDSLAEEAERASAVWSRLARPVPIVPHVDQGDTGATRWATRDDKWSAEMHYRARFTPDVPMMLMVADRQAIAALVATSGADAKFHEFADPTEEEAAADLARILEERKSDWGSLATALTMLGDAQLQYYLAHGRYAANVSDLQNFFILGANRLRILSATDAGWSAEATLPSFPGKSCVKYNGQVAEMPRTTEGKEITTRNGIACDTPDPRPMPSTISPP